MKRLLKIKLKNKYTNVRAIADYICIALMRYNNHEPKATFSATVESCPLMNLFSNDVPDSYLINDDTTAWYVIKIYQMRGSRNSIISPISNKYFSKCVLSDELLETMNNLNDQSS